MNFVQGAIRSFSVIPAQAEIHPIDLNLDARVRGHDGHWLQLTAGILIIGEIVTHQSSVVQLN